MSESMIYSLLKYKRRKLAQPLANFTIEIVHLFENSVK